MKDKQTRIRQFIGDFIASEISSSCLSAATKCMFWYDALFNKIRGMVMRDELVNGKTVIGVNVAIAEGTYAGKDVCVLFKLVAIVDPSQTSQDAFKESVNIAQELDIDFKDVGVIQNFQAKEVDNGCECPMCSLKKLYLDTDATDEQLHKALNVALGRDISNTLYSDINEVIKRAMNSDEE